METDRIYYVPYLQKVNKTQV
eukprot:COSAG01_NODE_21505_length_899_cov_0.911250_1_plen_20_part_10